MMTEIPALDPLAFNYDNPLIGIEQIRSVNPHRYEFEMLTGIVHVDPTQQVIIGFKDMRETDFWVRGHMPGIPLFPGVLMCEAAAQLCGYYYVSQKVGDDGILMGLAGIDEARFVRTVRPGERLIMVGTGLKVRRRLTRFRVVGQVGTEKAFETVISGVPLGQLEELRGAQTTTPHTR
jgi:3-hydroxyacyl-[acyl-carrier-protein] dehydratase